MWKTIQQKFDSTDSFVSLALGLAVVLVIGMTVVNYVKSKNQQAATTTNQEKTAENGTAALPTKHTVATGDTLWSIAEKYYKSGYNWVDLAKANKLTNPDVIEVGASLIVPAATPIQAQIGQASSTATVAPKEKSYTVVSGDDLWNIAVKQYGSGYKWVKIAQANKLANPGLIFAGNVLMLP